MIQITAQILERALRSSLERRGYESTGDLSLLSVNREEGDDRSVYVVLRDFDVSQFIQGVMAFVSTLREEERVTWYSSFTRAVFLFGDPLKLTGRHSFRHVRPDGSMAWLGPSTPEASRGLRFLLKAVETGGTSTPPLPQDTVTWGKGEPTVVLRLATQGLTLERYLVHLGHLVAEATLDGKLGPDAAGRLEHVDEIASFHEETFYLRVLPSEQRSHLVVYGAAHWERNTDAVA